jgi:hypothetical protein
MTTTRSIDAGAPLRNGLRLAVVVGALAFLVGLFVEPERAWGGFLMGFCFLTALALAGPVFLAFLTMAGARWSAPLERVPIAMTAALPAAAAMGVVLLFGIHGLYEWSHPAVVEHDAILQGKAAWLNTTGFALRTLGAFAVWWLLSRKLVSLAREFARTGSEAVAKSRVRWSALFIVSVALGFSATSMDWLMSLEPHWFSTMFPLMHFAGLGAAGGAAAVLLVLALERRGALAGHLRDEHLHDMGKLLFAMTLIWAYCWYCQYMLIWYTDMPEETVHYAMRQQGSWWLLVQASLVVKWAVPFVALLSRTACRNRKVLGRVAVVVLVGHALDLYVQVGPPLMGSEPALGPWELFPVIGAVALFFLFATDALADRSPEPEGHPYLADSLSYHTP